VIAASVVAAAGLATGLLLTPRGQAPKPATSLAAAPISLKSAQAALTGDVYVRYGDGTHANAEVSGAIGDAVDGEVAELYAQQFPYHDPPTRAASAILHPAGGTAAYSFTVTPVLATRYQVRLFKSSTAPAPFAASAVKTVYVTLKAVQTSSPTCGGPDCYESAATIYTVPPPALRAEMAKRPILYFGINLAANKPTSSPPPPKTLTLGAGHIAVVGTQRLAADQFITTVSYSFTVGRNDAYTWTWRECLKAAVAADGIGLPGQHGCGDQHIAYSAPYVG